MLAGVGIFTLLATVFAAFQLYGFIGPMTAFGLMALISIGALLLGLVHGPWISALGLVASFATPLLIKTDDPSVLGVFGYLSIISLVSWALARFRKWGWLDLATLAGGLFWLHFAHRGMAELGNLLPWYGFMGLGFIASTLIASKPKPATFKLGELPLVHSPITATIWAAIAGAILLQTINLMGYDFATEAVLVLTFVAAMVVSVIYSPRLIGHLAVGAAVAFGYFVATGYNVPNGQTGLSLALALAAIIGGAFFWILNGKKIPTVKPGNFNVWPYIGAFSPIMILIGAHVEVADINITWMAASFLGLAVLLLAASMMLRRSRDDQAGMFSPYPWAAALSYVLGLVIWQDGMGVSLGLIAGIAVFAALHMRLKWESLRWISLGFAGLAAIHIILDRLPDGSAISATPFMNELWIYLALPSLICFIAGFALTRSERDLPAEGLKAAGLVFLTLFAVFQVRHGMNDGVITSGSFSFAEIALQVLTGLCFTLGGVFLNVGEVQKTETIKTKGKKTGLAQSSLDILPAIMTGISYLTLAGFVLLLCFAVAPLFNQNFEVGGGPVFNDLILAYALPVILMLAILWKGQDRRPKHYLRLLAGLSLVGILMYVTSQIRRVFTGTGISIFDTFPDGLETYVISASWLLIGIGMLVAGLKLGSKSIRLGSGVVIILTVLKAFMIDMATLEGVLRAVSFVILGLVLIVIGRVYQKIL